MNGIPGQDTDALQVRSSPESEQSQGLVGVEGVLGSLGLGVGEVGRWTTVIVAVVDFSRSNVEVALLPLALCTPLLTLMSQMKLAYIPPEDFHAPS